MENQTISISLRGNDDMLIDQSVERIVETVEKHGAEVSLPISLPKIDILNPTAEAVDALMTVVLPDGVDIEISISPTKH